jgi:hypothetical protein
MVQCPAIHNIILRLWQRLAVNRCSSLKSQRIQPSWGFVSRYQKLIGQLLDRRECTWNGSDVTKTFRRYQKFGTNKKLELKTNQATMNKRIDKSVTVEGSSYTWKSSTWVVINPASWVKPGNTDPRDYRSSTCVRAIPNLLCFDVTVLLLFWAS